MKNKDEWSRAEDGQVLLNGQPYIPPFLRKKLKDASEQELEEATENLRRYLQALYRMFEKQEQERQEIWRRAEENRAREAERYGGIIGLS
jgi:hypothetical protein